MSKLRSELIPLAKGKVLEIGLGSGLNIPHYNDISELIALEPSEELLALVQENSGEPKFPTEMLKASAEDIPLDSNTFDTIVMTWTLCSVTDPISALSEIKRVIKPGGNVIFAEHGQSPDENIRKWQRRINPVWSRIAGGCQLNREIEILYESSGFRFKSMERGYIEGPKFATYNYRGIATLG
ncbi:class I SAM-dependent methyltransferase [Gammaproteobacteria bacterium]|nr:class I SAM-dependent methyltransferase [Gammaproteobacteria bacterium]